MANPTLLTPERHAKIVAALKKGLSLTGAARKAGTSKRVLLRWIQWGNDGRGEPFESLAVETGYARADREEALVENLDLYTGSSKERAPSVVLETLARTFPEEWGPRVNVRVEAEHELLFEAIRTELGEDIYARVVAIAARLGEGGEAEAGGAPALPPDREPPG